MSIELLATIITASSNFLVGLLIFSKNKKSKTHLFFFLLTLIIAFWSIANYFSLHSLTEEITLFWLRTVMFVTSPLGPIIFLFIHTFPEDKITLNKKALVAIISLMLTVAFLTYSPLIFEEVKFVNGNIQAIPGKLIFLFAIDFMGLSVLGFITLIKRYLKSDGIRKKQLLYMILGIVITFSLVAVTNFLFVLIFKSSLFVPFGPLWTLIMVFAFSYSILKHKLFQVKVVATELITILIWSILFSKMITSVGSSDFIINSAVFVSMIIGGVLLIKSVELEVAQKEKLTILTEKLKEIDKRKNEFINVAAHELRAPMTAIKGYLSMLAEGDAGKLSKEALEFLSEAIKGNDRLIRLVNNMLNVSRIEEGRMVYDMGIVNLKDVVKAVFDDHKELAKEKKLAFTLNIQEGVRDRVYVDKDRIYEVVANFISNAIKYTDSGSIITRLYNLNGVVRFEVTDTGQGVGSDEQGKLFHKFYRSKSSEKKVVGTGLGLYICKLLVNKFKGVIGVISESKKGSTFWFELPLKMS